VDIAARGGKGIGGEVRLLQATRLALVAVTDKKHAFHLTRFNNFSSATGALGARRVVDDGAGIERGPRLW